MRKVLFLITLLSFLFTSSVWAADISGNWTLKMSGRQGEVSIPMVIKADGGNLTVTATHPNLGEMAGTGTLKGNDISMNITATGERKIGFNLTGTVTGNKMEGTREFVRPAGDQGGAPGGGQGGQGAQGGQAAGGAQGGAPPSGGQGGQAQAGGQAQSGGQGGQGGQAAGGPQGGQAGGQTTMSNTWTAEKN